MFRYDSTHEKKIGLNKEGWVGKKEYPYEASSRDDEDGGNRDSRASCTADWTAVAISSRAV